MITDCEKIINKITDGEKPAVPDIERLLSPTDDTEREALFSAARAVRQKYFGNKVFLYGFIYFSTYCKNDCAFCNYRVSNGGERYRKNKDDVVQTAVTLKESGVHLIDLTMGEDIYFQENPDNLISLVSQVKNAADLPLMVSPGVLPPGVIDKLTESGADWYALYQETFSRALYKKMRVNQDYNERINAKRRALDKGMLIEEGLLAGFDSNTEQLARSIVQMGETGASQVRVMTYIPDNNTSKINFDTEISAIAVMRLLYPDLLIPASLDVDGLAGLGKRLNAGANVVTSLIPPGMGLAGVANAKRGIENGGRTVGGIAETLEKCGLMPAETYEYKEWTANRKHECIDHRRAAAGA